jgi:hypothetical protein
MPREWLKLAHRPHTLEQTLALLRTVAPALMHKIEREYSFSFGPRNCSILPEGVEETPEAIDKLRSKWGNPLECQLPFAPSTKYINLYGIGKLTERGYLYTTREGGCLNLVPFQIRTNVTDDINVQRGVRLAEGDGTVPLMSLGYMGAYAWTLVCVCVCVCVCVSRSATVSSYSLIEWQLLFAAETIQPFRFTNTCARICAHEPTAACDPIGRAQWRSRRYYG